jgi:hypothetical protein
MVVGVEVQAEEVVATLLFLAHPSGASDMFLLTSPWSDVLDKP